MSELLINLKTELQQIVNSSSNLREVSQVTFAKRGLDKNFPYFAISNTEAGVVTRIDFAPIASQKELKKLQSEKATGSKVLPMYNFYIDLTGVHLIQKSKNVDGVIEAIEL
jgi:hypothetical protein